jgi:hypothetical protein
MGTGTLELLDSVNDCQVAGMKKAGETLDPSKQESCETFSKHVINVQAAIIHTYQLTAFASLREADPAEAASLWKEMGKLCEKAVNVLKTLKDTYPYCGTPQLYDLALDYRSEAEKRYYQNLQDAECAKMPLPEGLFPKTT